jgi:hypothetical protein
VGGAAGPTGPANSFSNLTGLPTDNNALIAYVDPDVIPVAAGRALTFADNGSSLNYTGTSLGTFTIATSVNIKTVSIIKSNTGNVAITVANGCTLNGLSGGTVTLDVQYSSVAIQLLATNTYRVVA